MYYVTHESSWVTKYSWSTYASILLLIIELFSLIIKCNQFLGQLQQTEDVLWGPNMIGLLSQTWKITRTRIKPKHNKEKKSQEMQAYA
jgi:hypothetical protein